VLEGQSRALQTRMIVWFPKQFAAKNMAHWIGAQGQLKWVKHSKTCPLCDITKRKPHTQIK